MTVTIYKDKQPQLFTSTLPRQRVTKRNHRHGSLIIPALKASGVGGFSFGILLLLGLIPPPDHLSLISLAILVVPGFFVASLSLGLLAGILAGDAIKTSLQGGQVGWMSGFWTGIFGGIIAMFMAANGALMAEFGQSIATQVRPLELWGAYITADTFALAGRVFGAFVIYGLIGSLIFALLSAIGGMIYAKLSINSYRRHDPRVPGQ